MGLKVCPLCEATVPNAGNLLSYHPPCPAATLFDRVLEDGTYRIQREKGVFEIHQPPRRKLVVAELVRWRAAR